MEATNPCTAGSPFSLSMLGRLLRAARRPYRPALTLGLRAADGGHTRNGVAACTLPIRANPVRSGDAKPQDPMGQLGCRGMGGNPFSSSPPGRTAVATSSLETGGGKPEPRTRAEVVFLLLDGLRRTPPSGPSEVVLCALGLTREGAPHPLGLRVVPQEDERTWRALLGDLKADGVGSDLLLICSDGHPALIKAIHATYPETPVQISVAHRLLALARKVDARWRAACLAEARKIFTAPDRADAVVLFREWHARWLKQGEFAVRSLEADLASCLTFYRFPSYLWNKIRTVNLVERVFRDARRIAQPAAPTTEGWEEGGGRDEPPRANGEPVLWNGQTASAFADWDVPPGPEQEAQPAAATAPVETTTPPPETPPEPLVDRPEPVVFSTPEPAREPEAVGLHVSHLRGAEAGGLPVPPAPAPEPVDVGPRMLDLASDEAFGEWLQVYRRQAVRMKVVLAFTSAAGLIAGFVLSLR